MKQFINQYVNQYGRHVKTYKLDDFNIGSFFEYKKITDAINEFHDLLKEHGENAALDFEIDNYDGSETWFIYTEEVETDQEYEERKEKERQVKAKAEIEKQKRKEEQEQNRIRNEELNREKRYQQFLELQKEFGQ